MVDWSKTAALKEFVRGSPTAAVEERSSRTYPFSPISVVLMDDALQFFLGVLVISMKSGLRSLWSDGALALKMMPLGAIYAFGELLTLRSVQKSSGPVYVVIANMKLVVAAIMSRIVFGRSVAMPCLHWAELVLISLAAAVYTLLEAGSMGAQWHWEGAGAALAKSSLVAFSSVFCEHIYKSKPFYITLTLQAFWGLATIMLVIALSLSGAAASGVARELRDDDGMLSVFAGGPHHPLCDSAEHARCVAGLQALNTTVEEAVCRCVTARGWDTYTWLAVVADLSNAISSALVFRQLSAVAKYVCRATSAVPMYIFYCAVGRTSWSLPTFAVVIYLCAQVGVYTFQRHKAAASNAAETGWVQNYSGKEHRGKEVQLQRREGGVGADS